jgi:Ca-activated chloride channel family protein
MKFQWPVLLWFLLALPVLVALYVYFLRRRKQLAVRYASLELIKDALGRQVRRHIPPLLLLLALGLLLASVARPTVVMRLPSQQNTVILALDVSGSMRATDLKPSRLEAAQEAARAFVAEIPRQMRVGVVSFSSNAALVLPPTNNREQLLASINQLQLQLGTATGSGLLVSLATLFPNAGIDVLGLTGSSGNLRAGESLDLRGPSPGGKAPTPVTPATPGSNKAAAIILLTDGQRTAGPDPIEAARMAAERGVRIFTVGVGTTEGDVIRFEGWSFRAGLDEDTLKKVADMTGGEYFHAGSGGELNSIYEKLSTKLVFEKQETEAGPFFTGAGVLLVAASALLSMAWFGRIA